MIKDFENMLIRDAILPIKKDQIIEAFCLSKQTVVKETDHKSFAGYYKVEFVEYLEVLARISVIFFRDSEMHSESLKWKLNFLLDKILPNTVQMQLNKQEA